MLIFYFKAPKGITRALLSRIMLSDEKSIKCKILLEGPYTTQLLQLVKSKRNIVAVTVGLCSSAIYPHLCEVLKDVNEGEN